METRMREAELAKKRGVDTFCRHKRTVRRSECNRHAGRIRQSPRHSYTTGMNRAGLYRKRFFANGPSDDRRTLTARSRTGRIGERFRCDDGVGTNGSEFDERPSPPLDRSGVQGDKRFEKKKNRASLCLCVHSALCSPVRDFISEASAHASWEDNVAGPAGSGTKTAHPDVERFEDRRSFLYPVFRAGVKYFGTGEAGLCGPCCTFAQRRGRALAPDTVRFRDTGKKANEDRCAAPERIDGALVAAPQLLRDTLARSTPVGEIS